MAPPTAMVDARDIDLGLLWHVRHAELAEAGPVIKAHMESLAERMRNIEDMLLKQGLQQQTVDEAANAQQTLDQSRPKEQAQMPPPSTADTSDVAEPNNVGDTDNTADEPVAILSDEVLPPRVQSVCSNASPLSTGSSDSILNHILSTQGHWSYDELTGRLRYFGPTTNFHIYSGVGNWARALDCREQERHGQSVLRDIPQKTQDYLLDLYWIYYNSVLFVVHKEAFLSDLNDGRNGYYSAFLHLTLLAMGMRFADTSRPDIGGLILGSDKETRLLREAKRLVEYESASPGGVPSIQALLILGDLECGIGRDGTGWMYSGMACRLAIDIGLNLDCTMIDLPKTTVQVRYMVLWACIIYDKYWALFLGRPTMIKTSDLGHNHLSRSLELMADALDSLEGEIYRFLLQLMDFASRMTEILEVGSSRIDVKAYLAMAALDRKLNEWYARLPDHLRWRPANIQNAPASFVLLHQQFYALLILLHRPFANFGHPEPSRMSSYEDAPQYPEINQLSILSRKVCFDNSIRLARIFKYYHARFQSSQMFITGLDHAGTAATALIAGIASMRDPAERVVPLRYLQAMRNAMKGMSSSHKAAERMANVLDKIFEDPDWAETVQFSWSTPALGQAGQGLRPSTSLKRKYPYSQDDAQQPSAQKYRGNGMDSAPSRSGTLHMNSHNPTKKYYRAPNMDRDPGFGLDAIVSSSSWGPGSFPIVGTEWRTEVNDFNITDPLIFDDDFLNIDFLANDMLAPDNGQEMASLDDTTAVASLAMARPNPDENDLYKTRLPEGETVEGIIAAPSNATVEGPVSPAPFWPAPYPARHLSVSEHRKNVSWI